MAKYEKPRYTHMNEKKVLMVPKYKYDERLDICTQCFSYDDGICKQSSEAPCTLLARDKAAMCPLGFWSSYYGD